MDKPIKISYLRFQFLHRLYKESNSGNDSVVNSYDLGKNMELRPQETDQIVDYLTEEGLIDVFHGGGISITHKGIVEVETALSKPEDQTPHFPPVINIFNAQQIVNSSVKQGQDNSIQISHQDNNKIIWYIIVPIGVTVVGGIIVWWLTN